MYDLYLMIRFWDFPYLCKIIYLLSTLVWKKWPAKSKNQYTLSDPRWAKYSLVAVSFIGACHIWGCWVKINRYIHTTIWLFYSFRILLFCFINKPTAAAYSPPARCCSSRISFCQQSKHSLWPPVQRSDSHTTGQHDLQQYIYCDQIPYHVYHLQQLESPKLHPTNQMVNAKLTEYLHPCSKVVLVCS